MLSGKLCRDQTHFHAWRKRRWTMPRNLNQSPKLNRNLVDKRLDKRFWQLLFGVTKVVPMVKNPFLWFCRQRKVKAVEKRGQENGPEKEKLVRREPEWVKNSCCYVTEYHVPNTRQELGAVVLFFVILSSNAVNFSLFFDHYVFFYCTLQLYFHSVTTSEKQRHFIKFLFK